MNKIYTDINDFIQENNISNFTEIKIPVNSYSSNSVYNVSIFYDKNLNKYKMNCSCGEKFNIGKRKKCKHINNILQSFYKDIKSIDPFITSFYEKSLCQEDFLRFTEKNKDNIFKNFIIPCEEKNKPFPSLNNIYELLEKINKDIEEDDHIFFENSSMMQI